jgi:hypothetical protein
MAGALKRVVEVAIARVARVYGVVQYCARRPRGLRLRRDRLTPMDRHRVHNVKTETPRAAGLRVLGRARASSPAKSGMSST